MIWIALSEKDTDNAALEKRLWDAADQFRANSGLSRKDVVGIDFSCDFAGEGGAIFYCIAVGDRAQNLFP